MPMGAVVLLASVVSIGIVIGLVTLHRRPDPTTEGAVGAAALEALGGRVRGAAEPVVAVERRSNSRVLVELEDGTALDMFLFWPRPNDPVRLLDVWWRDTVGWVLEFELAPGGRQPFYAWRCRIAAPTANAA
jgi:hypothetical protein